jgi:tRNA pseudouridine55 synthase
MGRRRKGLAINGWLNVDKPVGLSSAACVNAVRRITGAAKLGHAGTLDPQASGVLPIALGEATKTMPYVTDAAKRYTFDIVWGVRRSTDDIEGEIVETSDSRPERTAIEAMLGRFIGEIEQVPPAYSAIKIDGQRAYAMARAGADVTLTARTVRVDDFRLVAMIDRDRASFAVACGKGTYMRALARDLAAALGTCGHLAALRRTAVGCFTEETAISLAKLTELGHSAAAQPPLLPVETALDDILALALTDTEAERLRSGQPVAILRPQDRERLAAVGNDGIVLAVEATIPVALARVDGIQIRAVRVLNL